MRTRWASCTPDDATIRISERLRDAPGWVVDYVLVHELAHLLEPSHNQRFQAIMDEFLPDWRARKQTRAYMHPCTRAYKRTRKHTHTRTRTRTRTRILIE